MSKLMDAVVRVSFDTTLDKNEELQIRSYSGTFKTTPAIRDWMKGVYAYMQIAQDEDGGMHNVGVEVLLAYEVHGYSIDDLYMRVFS